MNIPASAFVIDSVGRRGRLIALAQGANNSQQGVIRFEAGQELRVALDSLVAQEDGNFYLPLDAQVEMDNNPETAVEQQVIPVVAEELQVSKRQVETRTRLHKIVHERTEQIDELLQQEAVEVERVPINRLVDGPVETRQEGDTLIIPVLEEVLVIQKQLWLREEVHVHKRQNSVRQTEPITVRYEEVIVEPISPVTEAQS